MEHRTLRTAAMSTQVNCHCVGCNHKMCTSANSWIPVSNSHCTYEDPRKFVEYQMETLQQVREGAPDSQLEGCSVSPVRCKTCRATVGVRCVDAPEGRARFRYVTSFTTYMVPLYTSIRHSIQESGIYFYAIPFMCIDRHLSYFSSISDFCCCFLGRDGCVL